MRHPVYATGCHDTASAVAAVPAEGDSWCYISSGTWSLMGVELDAPVIDERSLALNLTNEMGAGGQDAAAEKYRRALAAAGMPARLGARGLRVQLRGTLAAMAAAAPPFCRDHRSGCVSRAGRHAGENLPRIASRPDSRRPAPPASVARTILESLALRYRAGARESGIAARQEARDHSHRGRRIAQSRAESVCGGCHWPHGDRRTGRGDGHGQRADSGDRRRRGFRVGRSARDRAAAPLRLETFMPMRRRRGTTPTKNSVK